MNAEKGYAKEAREAFHKMYTEWIDEYFPGDSEAIQCDIIISCVILNPQIDKILDRFQYNI